MLHSPASSPPSQRRGRIEKVFRDPVHGNISVRHAAVLEVLDSPEFQRLRRIHQLGMCHTVYHGAEHSRFQHSLGAMWLMHRVLRNWRDSRGFEVPEELELAATLAALLHDIGHGPFSHALENVFTNVHHEEIGRRILDERLRPLFERHGVDTDLVIGLLDGTAGIPYLSELLSSQVDVDRMDYLLRDSLYTGTRYGLYDSDRLIYALTPTPESPQSDRLVLALDAKGVHVVEEYLFSRYSMYWQIYFHKTTRACEMVLRSVLKRARDLFGHSPQSVYLPPNLRFIFETSLAKDTPAWLDAFLELDDTDLYHAIKLWRHSDDAILADLADRFVNRRLFKTLPAPAQPERRSEIRQAIVDRVGEEAARYYFHVDRFSDSAYGYFMSPHEKAPIRIVTTQGPTPRWQEISQVTQTHAVLALGHIVSRSYVMVTAEHLPAVRGMCIPDEEEGAFCAVELPLFEAAPTVEPAHHEEV